MVFWPHAGAWGAGVIHSAMRSAFVVSSCMYEEFNKKKKKKKKKNRTKEQPEKGSKRSTKMGAR